MTATAMGISCPAVRAAGTPATDAVSAASPSGVPTSNARMRSADAAASAGAASRFKVSIPGFDEGRGWLFSPLGASLVLAVTLWPVEVAYAGFESTDRYDFLEGMPHVATVLRIRVESLGGSLRELDLRRLRFYLDGEMRTATALYELLFAHATRVTLSGTGAAASAIERRTAAIASRTSAAGRMSRWSEGGPNPSAAWKPD